MSNELDASLPATAGSAHETIRMSSDVKWKQKHTSSINDHKHWTGRTSNRDLMMSEGDGRKSIMLAVLELKRPAIIGK